MPRTTTQRAHVVLLCFWGRVFSCFRDFRVVPGSTTDTGSRYVPDMQATHHHYSSLDRWGCLKGTCPGGRGRIPRRPTALNTATFPDSLMPEAIAHPLSQLAVARPYKGSPTARFAPEAGVPPPPSSYLRRSTWLRVAIRIALGAPAGSR